MRRRPRRAGIVPPTHFPAQGGGPIDRASIRLAYLWRHGRLPRLAAPGLFTERIQHRKLHDRDPRLPLLADKLAVKAFVADRLGADWVVPTLWHGQALPSLPVWPLPIVVKSRHGCRHVRFVHDDDAITWQRVRSAARKWMRADYGVFLNEWLYRHIPRGLLIEPFIGTGRTSPIDYKVFVFGGRAEYVQVHLDRGTRHRWIVMDRSWHRRSVPNGDPDPLPPRALPAMIEAAECLASGFDFVRVDLYATPRGPRFGEMTFYPGSGLDRFAPPSLDTAMGASWRRAEITRLDSASVDNTCQTRAG